MQWHTRSAEETEAVGEQLAVARPAGTSLIMLYLVGELGAGKTTLARGFVRGSGIAGPVRSPSYTLLELHESPALCILHLDLYRIPVPAELEMLGLREWARAGVLWLVEWPERGAGHLPAADLTITLEIERAGSHSLNAIAGSAFGESWLAALN